jgi:hypothetical protein
LDKDVRLYVQSNRKDIINMARIRSKHSDLLNYFIYDDKELSKEYVRKSKKFLNSIKNNKVIIDIFKEVNNISDTRKDI